MIMTRRVVCGQWSVVSGVRSARPRRRSGITLTEILIAIMILGIGLVSLATLFPIGLLRLRDASRWSRSALLSETAAADLAARSLLADDLYRIADTYTAYADTQFGLGL